MKEEKCCESDAGLYRSPFTTRWAGREMLHIWSDERKFRLWRRLWIALAQSQMELGLDIDKKAIEQMKERQEDIDLESAAAFEKELRHDVMAHIRVFGDQCPAARGIIHLGATSCFVADNAELVLIRESLSHLVSGIGRICRQLSDFAVKYRSMPCLAYTHYQPAQATTVGKRACLWLQDYLWDLENIGNLARKIPFRGVKGTTGTQAGFLKLFDGDAGKVRELERRVAEKMGFSRIFPVTGQTYPRKFDWRALSALAGLAISSDKMATDIRLLAGNKEIEEPFGKRQVGSSAMAYKRNPMRSERICGLSRFVINNVQNAAFTAAGQWMERTLDDSANRRLSLAEGFLAADSIVELAANVTAGLVVNEGVVAGRLQRELPFMATENILMEAVKAGGDRQTLHEKIRVHSMQAAKRIKEGDGANDLPDRLRTDSDFKDIKYMIDDIVDPASYIGRASQQVTEFVEDTVKPVLNKTGAEEVEKAGGGDLRV